MAAHFSFAPGQRRILTLLLAALIAYGVVRYARNPVYIADPQPPTGDRAAELADRLDPNTATLAELTAVPGMGAARAAKIIERRETVLKRDPTAVPFRSPDDLFYVERFGRSFVEQAKPYLAFPTTQNAHDKVRTRP